MGEDDEKLELEFLRYFYERAGEAMGPADWDVYYSIKEDFKKFKKLPLPKGYGDEE